MTIRNPYNRSHLLLLAGCLIILPVIPLLLGAGGDERSQQQSNRREVEKMTPAQRARLDRNFRAFWNMTDQQRKKYRDMHRRLHEAPDGAALRGTMAKYQAWLETLSPFQREELRQTSGIANRIELVRRFKAEQSSPAPLSKEDPRLSREDLAAMMQVIARKLKLPQKELDSMPELKQNLHILASLMREKKGEVRYRRWNSLFDDELIDKMLEALPNGEFRTAIAAIKNIPFVKSKREIVVQNIFEHLRKDVSQEIESKQPTQRDFDQVLERMKSYDRRRYESLQSPDERIQFLAFLYKRWQTYQFLKAYPELLRPFAFRPSFSRGRDGSRGNYPPRRDDRGAERGSPSRPERPFPGNGRPGRFSPGERP
jgi:hypothetical protein